MTVLESDHPKYLFNTPSAYDLWFYMGISIGEGVIPGSVANYTASYVMPFPAKIEREILEARKRSVFLTRNSQLKRYYTFKNIEVENFLSKHTELSIPLLEASEQIEMIFSENAAEIYLKVEADPEENFETLFIIIKTNTSPDKSLELLNRFDQEWWLDVDNKVRKILQVDIQTA